MSNPVKKGIYIGIGVLESIREEVDKTLEVFEEKGKKPKGSITKGILDVVEHGMDAFDTQKRQTQEQVTDTITKQVVDGIGKTMDGLFDQFADAMKSMDHYFKASQSSYHKTDRSDETHEAQEANKENQEPIDESQVVDAEYSEVNPETHQQTSKSDGQDSDSEMKNSDSKDSKENKKKK